MSRIETEYKGYKIVYGENSEDWTCYTIEFSNKSLATVKRKIDNVDRARRKAGAVPALCITDAGIVEVTVVEYEGVKTSRYGGEEGHQVYVVGAARFDKEAIGRSKQGTNNLCADTPENRALLTRATELRIDRDVLTKQIREVLGSIPTLDPETVRHLRTGDGE